MPATPLPGSRRDVQKQGPEKTGRTLSDAEKTPVHSRTGNASPAKRSLPRSAESPQNPAGPPTPPTAARQPPRPPPGERRRKGSRKRRRQAVPTEARLRRHPFPTGRRPEKGKAGRGLRPPQYRRIPAKKSSFLFSRDHLPAAVLCRLPPFSSFSLLFPAYFPAARRRASVTRAAWTAWATSWTRRICAPFQRATV